MRNRVKEKKVCKVCGGKVHAKELCRKHYYQMQRYGRITDGENHYKGNGKLAVANDVVYYDDYAELILTDRYNNEVGRTKIDIEDVKLFTDKRVCKDSKDYAICTWNGKQRKVHRIIMGVVEDSSIEVDHINGDPSDNRKCNLRVCTHSENLKNQKLYKDNTSGYSGVNWDKNKRRWVAEIIVDGKRIRKRFKSKNEAIAKRKEWEELYFGEFNREE